MRIRTAVLSAVAGLLLTASPAVAASPSVRLTSCDTEALTADFRGDMRTVPGASRLQMRFSVQYRALTVADATWQRVQAPNLDTWVSSLPGRSRYVYTKHVLGLRAGEAFRVAVRFRWRSADGKTVKSALRRSHSCRVPDPRPDLTPLRIAVDPGTTAGTRMYVVTVANRGHDTAPASSVSLDVGDEALPDQPAPALDPGERTRVSFDGPACTAGELLVTGVDATGLIDEAVEADDILSVPCPAA